MKEKNKILYQEKNIFNAQKIIHFFNIKFSV